MYRLVLDNGFDKIILVNKNNIQEIDVYTYFYKNKKDLLDKENKKLNRKFNDVYIESINENKIRYIDDIMYQDYYLLEDSKICELYFSYLIDDKSRIKGSFIYQSKKYKNRNIDNIDMIELYGFIIRNLKGYSLKRKCYFELVNSSYIKIKESVSYEDELNKLINSINTEKLDSEGIMIDKIKNEEIEKNYYDIEEYQYLKVKSLKK